MYWKYLLPGSWSDFKDFFRTWDSNRTKDPRVQKAVKRGWVLLLYLPIFYGVVWLATLYPDSNIVPVIVLVSLLGIMYTGATAFHRYITDIRTISQLVSRQLEEKGIHPNDTWVEGVSMIPYKQTDPLVEFVLGEDGELHPKTQKHT